MESLQGHVALVTGASQGIGRACAVDAGQSWRNRGAGRAQ